MFTTRFQTATRLSIATLALAGLALGVASAPSVNAAGIRNCVDISPAQSRPRLLLRGRLGRRDAGQDDLRKPALRRRDAEGSRPLLRPRTADRHAAGRTAEHLPARPRRSRRAGSEPWRLQHQAAGLLRAVQRAGHHQRLMPAVLDVRRRAEIRCRSRRLPTGTPSPRPVPSRRRPIPGSVALINLGPGAMILGTVSGH